MMWLLQLVPGLFTTVNGITAAISNERLAQINATTDQQRIQSQEVINSLNAKRDVLIAESANSNINAIVRATIGGSVAFVLGKIFVWDKALGDYTGGHTDALDPNLWNVIMAVVGFYFLYEASVNTARIIKA
jgi:hypothetical protein